MNFPIFSLFRLTSSIARCVDRCLPSYRWSSLRTSSCRWWRCLLQLLCFWIFCSWSQCAAKRISWRMRQADPRHQADGFHGALQPTRPGIFQPGSKAFFFFFVDCPGLCMKSCGHCEDLFNYCYVKPKELLHLLILTDGVSTVLFNTRRLSHWCEMITLHG